ncbi:hypothetical protein D1872_339590 [compost metagenome]
MVAVCVAIIMNIFYFYAFDLIDWNLFTSKKRKEYKFISTENVGRNGCISLSKYACVLSIDA